MQAKNLSFVNGSNLSNKSINIDNETVPISDFIKNFFPILKMANKNNGAFIAGIVVPIGMFNK